MKQLSIFVSSPGDLAEERALALRVVTRMANQFRDKAVIEPVFWEHEPLVATADFQSQLTLPSDADIMLCMLWSRLGTQLPEHITRDDGSRYASGTEFEFEDAMRGFRDKGTPHMLVYRKTAEPTVSLSDGASLRERLRQFEALEEFIQRWFHNAEDGSLTAAFHQFKDPAEFEDIAARHLRKLILQLLPSDAAEGDGKLVWTSGSPFRGLMAFDEEQAPVFFGRTRATSDVIDLLRTSTGDRIPFVLLVGMSGSGKSSLMRAGVIPLLTTPRVYGLANTWRRFVFSPSDFGDHMWLGFFRLMLEAASAVEDCELGDDTTPESLCDQVVAALDHDGVDQLVIGIDQLEEVFSDAVDVDQREQVLDAMERLLHTRRVVVLATLRSDFYEMCSTSPGLRRLKEAGHHYDLYPPTTAELAQIINGPAAAAGLMFERDEQTGRGLEDVLLDEASGNAESLPLLEFLLESLYEQRSGQTLTFAVYEELGGVSGALARRAEACFADLTEPQRAAFDGLIGDLIMVGDSRVITRRTAVRESLETSAERVAIVAAMVKARLLVVDSVEQDTGEHLVVVRLAHEALLRGWSRLQAIAERDRRRLQVRKDLEIAASAWEAADRPEGGLPVGAMLSYFDQAELDDAAAPEYLRTARDRDRARRRWRRRRRWIAVSAALAAAVVLAVTVVYLQRSLARERAYSQLIDDQEAVAQLSERSVSLWPRDATFGDEVAAWQARAEPLRSRVADHRDLAGDLGGDKRRRAETVVAAIDVFFADAGPWELVEERRRVAERWAGSSSLESAWDEALAAIAASPVYRGVTLTPMSGFVPLGADARSGLWEFADWRTGEVPMRGPNGALRMTPAAAMVFVLVPGGTFSMGQEQGSDDKYDNPDSNEGPVHQVTIAPFFISKYEVSQAQWLRVSGKNPSRFAPNNPGGEPPITSLHPVESLSWNEANEYLEGMGLSLPTEAQWEYAARGNTTTPWWTGPTSDTIIGRANLDGDGDGFVRHAPIDAFGANPFGLYNILGNVWEWALDPYDKEAYEQPAREGDGLRELESPERAFRGGGYDDNAGYSRSTYRYGFKPYTESDAIGIRPARALPR